MLLGLQIILKGCGASAREGAEGQDSIAAAVMKGLADGMENMLYSQFMPVIAFASQGEQNTHWFWQGQMDTLLPLYGYLAANTDREEGEAQNLRTIMLAEAEEGAGFPEEENLPEGVEKEEDGEAAGESLGDLLRAENEAALEMQQYSSSFIPHTKMNQVDLEPLKNYETLIQRFYTVDGNTTAGSDELNVDKLLEKDMRISREGEGPQILIYHTHSQEAFADSVPGDAATSIVGVGDFLAALLKERYGYNVMHYTESFDKESRDYAYGNSLPVIEQLLAEHPTIEVVIDLHRDAMPEDRRLVMDLQGRPTAQIMFFNGLSRTAKGPIEYLENPYLADNLAFSFQMQAACNEYYPGLARRIYLKAYRYNMHLCPKTLLIEMGAQNNTVEEMKNACEPLAHVLDLVLSGEEPKR